MTVPFAVRLSRLLRGTLALLLLTAALSTPLYAQDQDATETVRTHVYSPDGRPTLVETDAAVCPGDVPIGAEPLKIEFQVTTTSPTPVQYTATFAFSNTTLDATVTSDTHGNPSPVVDGGTTTSTVEGTLSSTSPFRVTVVTTAIAAGPAATDWVVRRGGAVTQEEHCTFTVLAPRYTLSVTSQPPGVPIAIEADGEDAGTATTPFSRAFAENTAVAFTAPATFEGVPFTQWQNGGVITDPRYETTVTGNAAVTAIYGQPTSADLALQIEAIQGAIAFDPEAKTATLPLGEQVTICVRVTNTGPDVATSVVVTGGADPAFFALQSVTLEPAIGTCSFSSEGGFFSCGGLTLAADDSVKVNVTGVGGAETEETGFSTSTGHPDDPDFGNNDDGVAIAIEEVEVTGAIQVIKFEDTNGNQVEDPEEPRLSGWTIYLDLNNNAARDADEPAAVTDASGEAVFNNLLPGTYIVREVQQDGFVQTFPPAPPFHEVMITESGSVETVTFGNFPLQPKIHGQVFEDANENGVCDAGEHGVDGLPVQLLDAGSGLLVRAALTMSMDLDKDGAIDPETEQGLYWFENLVPDTYIVRQGATPGWRQTVPLNPEAYTIAVDRSDIVDGLDFGNVRVPVGSIHGRVSLDIDNDGSQEGDMGLNGVVIELRDAEGAVVAQTTTMSMDLNGDGTISPSFEQGLYWFEDLLPGTYTVRQQVPDGYVQTFPEDDGGYDVTLNPGERVEGRHFSNIPDPASIHGQVFDDLDRDGLRDLGEPGKDGVPVQLIDLDKLGGVGRSIVDEVETMSMDLDGNGVIDPETEQGLYWFVNVVPGSYEVGLKASEGVTAPAHPGRHRVEVGPNDVIERIIFGTADVGSIHGQLFLDRDGNGHPAPPYEAGINGETVELLLFREGVAEVVATTTTMSMDIMDEQLRPIPDGVVTPAFERGLFWFSNLEPGRYLVRVPRLYPDGSLNPFQVELFVTVNVGQSPTTVELGATFTSKASVHGQVFEDLNRNGVRDPGEVGLDGMTVRLLDRNKLAYYAGRLTMSMDLDGDGSIDPETEQGLYWFEDLHPDLYFVELVTAPGQVTFPPPPGLHTVVLVSTKAEENVNFGVSSPAALHGQKFFDANGDGVRAGADETGLNGWVIELVNAARQVVARDTTHSRDLDGDGTVNPLFEQGLYWFGGLPPGDYIVREQVRAGFGFRQTAPPDPGDHRVTLVPGQELDGLDFGNTNRGAVHGQKFLDRDGDGNFDPDEAGLDDVVIELVDAGGTVVASTRTMSMDLDGDGRIDLALERGLFWFRAVRPGTYIVREVVKEPLVQTFPSGDGTYTVTVGEGEINDAILFGNASFGGAIHGQKFLDRDGDGRFDIEDPGLNGILIELVDAEGVVVDSTRTMSMDEDGDGTIDDTERGLFWFPQVVPGTYTVREVTALPLVQTFPPGDGTYAVTVDQGQVIDSLLFGNGSLAGAIHGQKFLDREGDSRRSPSDPGLDGVGIELLDEDGAVQARTTTMSMDLNGDGRIDPALEQGLFWFEGLNAGTYTVREVVVPPFTQTFPPGDTHTITLDEREVTDIDAVLFGNTRPASIHGQKFLDRNGDGQRNRTDPGLDEILIELFDATNTLVDSVRTMSMDLDGDGQIHPITERGLFWFENLEPGAYRVAEPLREGFRATRPREPKAAPLSREGERVGYDVTLGPAERLDTLLFGNLRTGSIHLQVVEDADRNSFPDDTDPRRDGAEIEVSEQDGRIHITRATFFAQQRTMSMDLDNDGVLDPVTERGLLWIEDLPPGLYFVELQPPHDQVWPLQSPIEVRVGPGERVEGLVILTRRVERTPVNAPGDAGDTNPGDGTCDTGGGKTGANLCTFRAALEECNARSSEAPRCALLFDVPSARAGKQAFTIRPQRPLPPITRPISIVGDGVLVLDGSEAGAGADGLVLNADESFLKGLTITGFPGHGVVLNGANRTLIDSNTITANGGDGIRVLGGAGNTFQANTLAGNGGLAIDLGGDGPTANDADDADTGANTLQNFPVLTTYDADRRVLEGMLTSTASVRFVEDGPVFRVEVFSSPTCGAAEPREPDTFLGSALVATDLTGAATFTMTLDADATAGPFLVATATDPAGNTSEVSDCLAVTATSVEGPEQDLPDRFSLHANYPNPFNPRTTIRYALPQPSRVHLAVYNVLGQRVAVLVDDEQHAGTHTITFDGARFASGVYFYRLTAGAFREIRAMVMVK